MIRERKPFDPAVRLYFDGVNGARAAEPPPQTEEAKLRQARAYMVEALQSRISIVGLPNSVISKDVEAASGLMVRLYRPADDLRLLPVLLYVHGGGWSLASVDIFDPFCRLLCEASGVIVVSVEYRLAPEYPYPAGLNDVLIAARWVREHATASGGDPARIAIGGDSAGANLAAVAANMLCALGGFGTLRAQMLLYSVTDHPRNFAHSSYLENASGYGLEAHVMHWFWDLYARYGKPSDPSLSPLRMTSIPSLPPTLIATSEYNVLRDEGIAYAKKLADAEIAVVHLHSPDMGHNFPATPGMVNRFPQSVETLQAIAAWLSSALAA